MESDSRKTSATTVTPLLEVRDLMVFFENALAVNGLSLEVQTGEIVAVIGSNSAGKTTLMNALSGLIIDMRTKRSAAGASASPSTATSYSRERTSPRPSQRTGEKGNRALPRAPPGVPGKQRPGKPQDRRLPETRSAVKQTIAYVFELFPPLARLKSRKAGFMSGGEQQMLAIGMALVVQPKLLLLDEPLLGLSPLMQQAVMQAIVNLKRHYGITVVLSEQFARPVLPVIDRDMWLKTACSPSPARTGVDGEPGNQVGLLWNLRW